MFDIFDVVEPEKKNKVKPKKIITYSDSKKNEYKTTTPETSGEAFANFTNLEETVSENVKYSESKHKPKITEDESLEEEEQQTQEFLEEVEDVPLNFLENPETGHVFIGRKPSVLQKYGEEASLYLGRVKENGYPEKEVYFDSLDPQTVFVCGSRGSGKSYMLGVIAEELAMKNKNVGQIVIDPVGVFWSMKHPNRDTKEISSLSEFGLEPKGLENVVVFIPEGAKEKTPKETYDATITLQPSFLMPEDWALTFNIDRFSPSGLLLEKVVKKVEDGYRTLDGIIFKPKKNNYDLNDIIYCLEQDVELNSKEKGYRKDSIRALVSRFEAAKTWGIFSKKGTPLIELSVPGQLTIIDTSFLDETVSALLVGILARRILSARKMGTRKEASQKMHDTKTTVDMENDVPPTWLFIDEAHTLVPSGSLATPASKSIIEYVKQGRKPGCSLVIATQQPSAIDTRVLSQVGTLVTYKLVFDDDIRAVFKRMPTVVPRRFKDPAFIKRLSVGIPLVADRVETTSRAFVMTIRPRMSHHEGRETQTADIKHNLTLEEVLEVMCDITKNKIKQFEELDEHSLKTLLKILNMKYKTEITFEKFAEKLIASDVIFDNGKYFMEKDAETEKYEERVSYNVIDADYEEEEIVGLAKRATGWQNLDLKPVYRPIFKVNYKIYNEEGSSFVNHFCYIDPLKVEFVHLVNNDFVYSEGLSYLRLLEADDIRILLSLPKRQGFDMEYLKENSTFGDVKLKNTMDRLISMGLLRKEKRGTKNVYFMIKTLEIPTKPINKLLTSLNAISLSPEDVAKENILETRANYETIRSILGTLWGEIRIDDIETILRRDFIVTNNDTKDTVIFDSFSGKQVK